MARYVLAALAAALAASSANAAIDVAAGEACTITAPGAFTCEWLNANGSITVSTGWADISSGREGWGGFLEAYDLPDVGKIEVHLPYQVSLPWEYNRHKAARIFGYVGIKSEKNLTGKTLFQTIFTGMECNNPKYCWNGKIDDTPNNLRITGHSYATGLDYTVLGDGFWDASFKWSLGPNSDLKALYFSSGANGIPEPASWAMMVLGFGIVGIAARRRPVSARPA